MERDVTELNVTYQAILTLIGEQPSGMRVSEIARQVDKSYEHVSRVLRHLQRRGLLERFRPVLHNDYARSEQLSLSPIQGTYRWRLTPTSPDDPPAT